MVYHAAPDFLAGPVACLEDRVVVLPGGAVLQRLFFGVRERAVRVLPRRPVVCVLPQRLCPCLARRPAWLQTPCVPPTRANHSRLA
eukprot:2490415-Prymnesium_polylepis.1